MGDIIMKIRKNRRLLRIVLVLLIVGGSYIFNKVENRLLGSTSNSTIYQAISQHQSDVQVEATGKVIKILPDDNQGSRHQRFLLKLESGDVILIAHNIDLAPRVKNLDKGDSVSFSGEYEWNDKGGVVHWTHHDPQNYHPEGWLKFQGKIYQ